MEYPAPQLDTPSFLELMKSEKPVLVDFYATWCEPCNYLDEILTALEIRLGTKATIMKLDVDEQTELSQHFQIRSVPTLMIFKNGELKWRMAGFKLVHELEEEIIKFI
ncbi:MAG: thioredoxin fold domain-containing protein [Bacteroidetes bacterium]|nr:thioredoxin fold domain-containing protein [Bacteroidota bacterium]